MNLPPPLNHVFVDYENVQELHLAVIGSKNVTFTLLVGPHKKKLDVELVEQLFAHAASVELVRLSASGRNALDFALAYYVGRAVATDPAGFFHIVSKDTGYDPMIEHLRSRHVKVRRHPDFSTLTFSSASKPQATPAVEQPKKSPAPSKMKTSAADKPVRTLPLPVNAKGTVGDTALTRVLEHLRSHPINRPKRRKTLVSHLSALLGKQPVEGGIEKLIDELIEASHLAIDAKNAVTYTLPKIGS
jgi:hypothetical protein